jgi:protein SCO1/2
MSPQSKAIALVIIALAGVAGAGGAFLWRDHAAPVTLLAGTYLSPQRALPDFSLIDAHGRAFGIANLKGSWSMLFFGYTNCPDFCPTTLTLLASMEKRLRAAEAAVRPQVIFMSVDAKRDTPAQLAQYVPYFDRDFIGITAARQTDIAAVAAKLGVSVIITPKPDGTYSVDHSGEIFVVNPRGEIAAILTGPFTVDELTTDFQRTVAAHS